MILFSILVLKILKRSTKNKFGLVVSGLPREHIYKTETVKSIKNNI